MYLKSTTDNKTLYKKQFALSNNIADFFSFALFLVYPLFVYPDYTNITETKVTVFSVITLVFFFAIVFIMGGVFLDGFRPNISKRVKDSSTLFLLMYVTFLSLSGLICAERGLKNSFGRSAFFYGSGRYDGFLMLCSYLVVYIILSNLGDFNKKHIYVICTSLIVMNLIGIIQTFGINAFDFYPTKSFDGKLDNFISTVGNFDFFSAIITMFVPITAASIMILKTNFLEKCLLLSALSTSIYLLFSLNVSSGKLSMAIVLVLLPILFKGRKEFSGYCLVISSICFAFFAISVKENNKAKSYLFLILILSFTVIYFCKKVLPESFPKAVIVFAIALEIFLFGLTLIYIYNYIPTDTNDNYVNRDFLTEISNTLHGHIDETTGTYRVGIWKYALKLWAKHPLLGVGMGHFLKTFADFSHGKLLTLTGARVDTCHNEYLQILCVGGLLSLISYLGFIGSLILKAIKKSREKCFLPILLFGLTGYLIQAFFNFNIVITAPIFWALLGCINNQNRS